MIPASEQLRKILRRSVRRPGGAPDREGGRSEADEIAYRSWPISYVADDALVVAIGTYPRYASLFFFRGRELDDGSRLLEGAGKQRGTSSCGPRGRRASDVQRMLRKAFRLGGITARGESG